VVSAIAIVITAIYASIQIRHNTRAVRASAFQQVVNSFAEISFEIASDKELVELFIRASRSYDSLGEADRVQYSFMLLSFLRRAENVLFQSNTHMLTSEHWSGIRSSIQTTLTPHGARLCWSEIRDRFNPEFRIFIDKLVLEQA
jgi:hypothetical protein